MTRWLGIFLMAYYLLTLGGHQYSVDGIVAFQRAKSLLFRHTLAFDPPVRWGMDMSVTSASIGLSLAYLGPLVLALPVLAGRPDLQATPYDPTLLRNPALYANLPYLLCSWLIPALTAATGCLVFRLGRLLGLDRAWAVGAGLALGLASPAAAYARYDFNQPLAMLLLTAAVYGLVLAASGGGRFVTLAGVALGGAVLTRPETVVVTPLAAFWVWRALPGCRAPVLLGRLAALAVPVVSAIALNTWINHAVTPTRLLGGPQAIETMFVLSPSAMLVAAVGLLASPARGVLLFFPLAWLGLPGLLELGRRARGPALLLGGFVVLPFVVYTAYYGWWGGGWCWGPRFLVPCMPILALGAAAWAAGRRGWRRGLFIALAAAGVLVSWNGILFDPLDFGRWRASGLGLPDDTATQFRLGASPIVAGWSTPPHRPLDIVWLRAIDPEQLRRHAGLIADESRAGWVRVLAPFSVVVAGTLMGLLVLSGTKLARLARRPHSDRRAR